jgi:hypothetical protein
MKYILLSLLLSSCSLVQYIPSTTACHEVHYDRIGNDVELNAKCKI